MFSSYNGILKNPLQMHVLLVRAFCSDAFSMFDIKDMEHLTTESALCTGENSVAYYYASITFRSFISFHSLLVSCCLQTVLGINEVIVFNAAVWKQFAGGTLCPLS